MRFLSLLLFVGAAAMFANGVAHTGSTTISKSVSAPIAEDWQAVSRMVYAEAGCESTATQIALAYVIASSARNAGLAPARATQLDKGHYLSSYLLASVRRAGYFSDIYFSSWNNFSSMSCAQMTIDAVRLALSLPGNTGIYHFDACTGVVDWKKSLIEFRMTDGDSMCLYARTQAEIDLLKSMID